MIALLSTQSAGNILNDVDEGDDFETRDIVWNRNLHLLGLTIANATDVCEGSSASIVLLSRRMLLSPAKKLLNTQVSAWGVSVVKARSPNLALILHVHMPADRRVRTDSIHPSLIYASIRPHFSMPHFALDKGMQSGFLTAMEGFQRCKPQGEI